MIHGSLRYVDYFDQLVENYNHSFHHTIKGKPASVHFVNQTKPAQKLIQQIHKRFAYINEKTNTNIPETLHYKKGNKVRVLSHISPFILPEEQRMLSKSINKISKPKWSVDVFTVYKKIQDGKFVFYQMKAPSGVVFHRKYYHW